MSLTKDQDKYLSQYLKDVGISHQEPFEEFYDHIATAFEESGDNDLKTYIRDVAQPAFGGTKGILRIVKEQNKIRKALIWQRAKSIFLNLFGWPAIGVVIASFWLIQFGIQQFGQEFIIILTLGLGLGVPLLVIIYGYSSFYLSCKRKGLPYSSNDLNACLLSLIHFPFTFLNLCGNLIIPIMIGRETFKAILISYPIITICSSTFILLVGYTYLRLLKEQFIFKLEMI